MPRKKKTAVVSMKDVEKRMSVYATGGRARLTQPTGNNIGTRNSRFTYKNEVIGRTLRVIILDFIHSNSYYDSAFDPDNPTPPACLSFSEDGKEMVAFDTSPDKQHETCDGCPQNAWGSAEKGRGKACKNGYKLAVMECESDPESADIAYLSIPPTSMKNFGKYIKGLDEKFGKPCFGFVTIFSFDEQEDNPTLQMGVDEEIDQPGIISAIMDRLEGIREGLMEPPDFSGYSDEDERPTRRKAKKTSKKKASNKKVSKKSSKKKTAKKKTGSSKFS